MLDHIFVPKLHMLHSPLLKEALSVLIFMGWLNEIYLINWFNETRLEIHNALQYHCIYFSNQEQITDLEKFLI